MLDPKWKSKMDELLAQELGEENLKTIVEIFVLESRYVVRSVADAAFGYFLAKLMAAWDISFNDAENRSPDDTEIREVNDIVTRRHLEIMSKILEVVDSRHEEILTRAFKDD